ncbi:MAG TPA: YidC/Oxa1 family membrane protein insertase [Patescibacteria group bacterium]|nr:YidC/Oxa1 family membrane protein insertase [Patescibacteria group bacterium]
MWDAIIINPMTNALMLLYDFLGHNFVLAIAVFTILIRLVTLPLNLRQQKSSLRMQEIQPQIQSIQKKHKDNPQKMNEEFKKIGYNPTDSLTGCLPLLIQFPILIGLYRAIITLLGSTPQALFQLTDRIYAFVDQLVGVSTALPIPNKFLWLNLAQPDPLYILPVLVFGTMFISQKLMTPDKPKEDKDKKKQPDSNPMAGMTQSMQYTMPLMFGFFSLSFPSGLSIYFILSNLIGIGQGYITKNNMAKERAAREAEKAIGKTTGIPAEAKAAPATVSSTNGRTTRPTAKQRTSKRKRRSAKR